MWARTAGTAHTGLARVMALGLGSASVVLVALQTPLIVEGLSLYHRWWTFAVLAVLACSTIALTGFFWKLSVPGILRWSAVHAATILFALATVIVAVLPGTDLAHTPWIVNVLVLGAAAAAVAFRGAYAWGYFGILVALLFIVAMLTTGTGIGDKPFQDAIYNTFYLTLCFSLALATHRAGRLIDEAAEAAIADARATAAATARATEDTRMQALVHDSVLVALLAFARGSTAHDPGASEQARRALVAIEHAAAGDSHAPAPVTLRELGWSVQAAVTDLDPRAAFRFDQNGEGLVPAEVVDALREATGEALRNSLMHAGHGLQRSVVRVVHVRTAPGEVDVDIIDDGRGFELARIGAGRLGITVSIEGRMDQLPGGSSVIRTAPGGGTHVALLWRQR